MQPREKWHQEEALLNRLESKSKLQKIDFKAESMIKSLFHYDKVFNSPRICKYVCNY